MPPTGRYAGGQSITLVGTHLDSPSLVAIFLQNVSVPLNQVGAVTATSLVLVTPSGSGASTLDTVLVWERHGTVTASGVFAYNPGTYGSEGVHVGWGRRNGRWADLSWLTDRWAVGTVGMASTRAGLGDTDVGPAGRRDQCNPERQQSGERVRYHGGGCVRQCRHSGVTDGHTGCAGDAGRQCRRTVLDHHVIYELWRRRV